MLGANTLFIAVFTLFSSNIYDDALSNTTGKLSVRDPVQGAWYIQELCRIFIDKASERQVEDMLKEVNTFMCSDDLKIYHLPQL